MGIGRRILGILGGLIAAGATVALVETLGHRVVRGEAVFAVAVFGYGIAALIGVALTQMIADRPTAVIVPLVLAGLAAINVFSFPHPPWFIPAAAAALSLGGWIGALVRWGRAGQRNTTEAKP